jgi:hypothetical protein
MDKALLDTDVFSEVLKRVDPNVAARAAAYLAAFGRYTVSLLSVVEIVSGLQRRQRQPRIQQFLAGLSAVLLPLLTPTPSMGADAHPQGSVQPASRFASQGTIKPRYERPCPVERTMCCCMTLFLTT